MSQNPADHQSHAGLNLLALTDFFARVQPRYRDRLWFLTGESYAGVYIPTLANRVLRALARDSFPNPHLQGLAIGNGYLNARNLTNSLVHWHVFHGGLGFGWASKGGGLT